MANGFALRVVAESVLKTDMMNIVNKVQTVAF